MLPINQVHGTFSYSRDHSKILGIGKFPMQPLSTNKEFLMEKSQEWGDYSKQRACRNNAQRNNSNLRNRTITTLDQYKMKRGLTQALKTSTSNCYGSQRRQVE